MKLKHTTGATLTEPLFPYSNSSIFRTADMTILMLHKSDITWCNSTLNGLKKREDNKLIRQFAIWDKFEKIMHLDGVSQAKGFLCIQLKTHEESLFKWMHSRQMWPPNCHYIPIVEQNHTVIMATDNTKHSSKST